MEIKHVNIDRKGIINIDRAIVGVAVLVVAVMIAFSWSFAPSFMTTVSAANQETAGGATTEMLNYALNFRSASNLAVFGGNSVSDNGSEIRGVVGSTGDVTGVSANAMDSGDQAAARRDLSDVFAIVDQLPCTQVSGDLSGQTFAPGVYCVGSATLAGRMTVDAGGDENARFVFRVDGTFRAEDAAGVIGQNGARATNVYIFARQSASIGANAAIAGSVISREDVTVGNGSTVSGKVIGVNGDVVTNANIVAAGTGYIEICKQLAQYDRIPVGTQFNFTVSGIAGTIAVPAGAWGSPNCSAPIQVAAGNVTVTEVAVPNTAVVAITAVPSGALTTANTSLPLRQAVLSVPQGDVTNEVVVTYTNQTTRTGTIEICKFAAPAITGRMSPDLPADPDVSGFFDFTVVGVPGQTFSVPVGFCSGPITLTLVQQNAGPSPAPTAPFRTVVTELAKPTYRCENVTTFPANALFSWFPDGGFYGDGTAISQNNPNGCYANVDLNVAGGAANQTTVRFFNRSLPGRIKICKISADPVNLPYGTTFRFRVYGLQGPLPGTAGHVDVDVLGGPASQGGFCAFAPGTWVVGSNVFIQELGISPANTTTLPLDQCAGCAGNTQIALQVSRIQASTPFPQSQPYFVHGLGNLTGLNPDLVNANAIIQARNTTAEIQFTDFVYRPAILKLCKVAGPGVQPGTPFTFTIAPADPLTTWPYPTGPITVAAGSCTFVNGPFPADPQFPGVGLFNYGTLINVSENVRQGTTLTAITSPTLGGTTPVGTLEVDLLKRFATMSLNQSLLPNYRFNEISFTNVASATPPPGQGMRYDFDGDHKSDLTIYRPSTGLWWFAPSSTGGIGFRSIRFGIAGDIPVAADYDGDGMSDAAVYRNGVWYVLGSTGGYMSESFGLPTDIPQVGDYDGDNKADFAVYRPSNGTWYIMGSSAGFMAVQFGISTDIPVAADFDGDGRIDPAVYRNGTWYISGSANGLIVMQFGIAGDVPLHVDFDGDGMADEGVYRNGTWYIMGSSTGFRAVQFGTATDIPVPADYDGDGKMDIAVYRPSTTVWHILKSGEESSPNGGYVATQFGSPGDALLPY